MKITSLKVKLFGKTETMFRVLDAKGGVVFVGCTAQECEEFIAPRAA